MSKLYVTLSVLLACSFVDSQNVNNVHLVNHGEYMTEVLTEIGHILEEKEWCNLKIPDFEMEVQQVVLSWQVNGTVHFENGFVVSLQRLDILESSLNQIWSWDTSGGHGMVEVRGTLRMHDLKVGFDVMADFNGNIYHSSATFVHPLISFEFSIFRNTATLETTVVVAGTHPLSNNKLDFLPVNNATYVIRALFDSNSTYTGITSWASEVFQPIAVDVVMNKVTFPVVCYNCPLTST